MEKILGRGAEATITLKDNKIIKKREPKRYRHKDLDNELRIKRSRREARIIEEAGKIIALPKIISYSDDTIVMEYINGETLKETINKNIELAEKAGESLGTLHNNNIIHGDLTTSNMILKEKKIFFIDFGLSQKSRKTEDKAVDIHLFRQALESKHHEIWEEAYKLFIKGYKKTNKDKTVFERLKKVERRGRNKNKKMKK